jgi:5-methylcytosine-specific restriction endonuclease McrA
MGKMKNKQVKRMVKNVCIEYLTSRQITCTNTHCLWMLADCMETVLGLTHGFAKNDKSDLTSLNRLKAAYTKITGKPIPVSHNSIISTLQWQTRKANGWKSKAGKTKKPHRDNNLENQITAFYSSYAWRNLRYIVLQKYGRKCMLCGSEDRICVDHIKPLRKYWSLRLDITNLQVLCEPCNHGKGNWDETDWRPKVEEKVVELRPKRIMPY